MVVVHDDKCELVLFAPRTGAKVTRDKGICTIIRIEGKTVYVVEIKHAVRDLQDIRRK